MIKSIINSMTQRQETFLTRWCVDENLPSGGPFATLEIELGRLLSDAEMLTIWKFIETLETGDDYSI